MNLSTCIVAGLVAAVFAAVVGRGIYNRKKGRSSCSCGCSAAAVPQAACAIRRNKTE